MLIVIDSQLVGFHKQYI